MTQHAASHPRRIPRKTHDRGTAHALHQHGNRLKTAEATGGVIGTGATIVGTTVQTTAGSGNPSNYFPGIVYDSTGLRAYNSGGVITMSISAADGSVTVNGTGVITGGTIQTSATPPRVIMDASGIRAYNPGGSNTFNLDGSTGNLTIGANATITGSTIQTSSGSAAKVIMDNAGIRAYDTLGNNTVTIDTAGKLTVAKGSLTLSNIIPFTPGVSGAGITMDLFGIKVYNASNQNTFAVDGTTGLITATGIIQATTGSAIPVNTVTGQLPGSANRYSNSWFQDAVGSYTVAGWNIVNATNASGGIAIPPVYGVTTAKLTSTGGDVTVTPSNTTDSHLRVLVGLNYTFSHYVYPATVARSSRIDISWYNAAGALLSTTTGAVQTTTINQWTRVVQTAVAPANAAFAIGVHYVAIGSAATEVTYIECFQMELGDRVSSWDPRSDEINVASLSAISANLGIITAGTVTGAILQTSTAGQRIVMDTSSLRAYSADGDQTFVLGADGSIAINYNSIPNGSMPFNIDGWHRVDSSANPGGFQWLAPGVIACGAGNGVASFTGMGSSAFPVNPGDVFRVNANVASDNASGQYFIRIYESTAASLNSGYISQPGQGGDTYTSYTDMIPGGATPPVSTVTRTFTYTVPANVKWVTFALYNWGSTGWVYYSNFSMKLQGAPPVGQIRAGSFIGGAIHGATVSASSIVGGTVTGATLQTSETGSGVARVVIGTAFGVGFIQFQNASGSSVAQIDPVNGIGLVSGTGGGSPLNEVGWHAGSPGGTKQGAVGNINNSTYLSGQGSGVHAATLTAVGASTASVSVTISRSPAGPLTATIMDGSGFSSFASSSSDARLKTDIIPHTTQDSLKEVRSLLPTRFRWADTGRHDKGLVAQDVMRVLPEAVRESAGEGHQLSVEPRTLLASLVGAVQELHDRGALDHVAVWRHILEAKDFAEAQARVREEITRQLEEEHFDRVVHEVNTERVEKALALITN